MLCYITSQRLPNGSIHPDDEAGRTVELQELLDKQNFELAQAKERMAALAASVAELEEDLSTARRDLIKSEEMSSKYQRDLREVRVFHFNRVNYVVHDLITYLSFFRYRKGIHHHEVLLAASCSDKINGLICLSTFHFKTFILPLYTFGRYVEIEYDVSVIIRKHKYWA